MADRTEQIAFLPGGRGCSRGVHDDDQSGLSAHRRHVRRERTREGGQPADPQIVFGGRRVVHTASSLPCVHRASSLIA